jgi:GTP-binding protein
VLLADLPGLIEGASHGKGLGQRFLRHIERTRFLLLMIDSLDPHPEETFAILRRELVAWSAQLGQRRYRVCYSKVDLLGADARRMLPALGKEEPLVVSSHTGEGIPALLHVFEDEVLAAEAPEAAAFASAEDYESDVRLESSAEQVVPGEEKVRMIVERPWPTEWKIPQREGALPPPKDDQEDTL